MYGHVTGTVVIGMGQPQPPEVHAEWAQDKAAEQKLIAESEALLDSELAPISEHWLSAMTHSCFPLVHVSHGAVLC